MGRKRQRDVVDFIHQRPEQRLRELGTEEICNFCDAPTQEYGSEHSVHCPRYYRDDDLADEVLDEIEYEEEETP